ncbi:polysaccharide biosynthesis C-terminal domain-containing protein [Haloarcula litorea]|uniref:oligosaccharide flippase family protein n=1 Tax=Haloarcula litorea TaxID=3032579 RepID=UPI0023E8B113|nr:polysaccharide biosynthesis C-terminal domain-containing protein [Halomicroarcula sp. GDY20]
MSDSERDVTTGFLSILSGEFGALLVGLVITPVLVRELGSAQYGAYAFVISVLSVLLVVINGGISDGIRKFIAEKRDREWQVSVLGFYTRIALLAGVGLGVVLGVAVWSGLVARLLGGRFEPYVLSLAVLLVARQLFLTARSALMGLGLESQSEPLAVVQRILFGVVGLALVSLGYGVVGALAGHIVATLVVGVVAFALVTRRLEIGVSQVGQPGDVPRRELLSFNVLSVVLTLLMTSLYHVDILLLQPLAGSQVTGYYRAALLIAEFVWFVPFALQMVLLHSTAELWADDRTDEISRLAARATRYTVALALLVTLGIASLVDAFVPLYFGSEFAVASDVVLLLLPGAFGFAVARPIFAIGQGKGDLRTLIVATGAAALLNLVLNLLLIPPYGMTGAAVATSVAYGSMLVLHVLSARRIGFDPLGDLRLGAVTVAGLVTAGAVFGSAAVLASPLLSLLVVPPVGALVFSSVAVRAGVVTGSELEPTLRRVPEPLSSYLARGIDAIEAG